MANKQSTAGLTANNTSKSSTSNFLNSLKNMVTPTNTKQNTRQISAPIETASRASNTIGNNKSNLIGALFTIIILAGLIYAGYWGYNWYSANNLTSQLQTFDALNSILDAKSGTSVGGGSIPSSRYSNEYAISIWMKIDDYTYRYGQEKVVLCRGDIGSGNPEIVLGANNNDLTMRVQLQSSTGNTIIGDKSAKCGQVSGFVDVAKTTVELPGADEHRDTTHKQVPFIDENAKFQLDNSMFAMISGNEIEYPTVKYYNDAENGANSQRYLQDVMNDKSMRILNSEMVDSAIKEGFTVTTTTTTTPTYPLIPQGIATSSCMSVPREHVSCGCNLSTDSSGVQAIPIGVSGVSALRVEAQVVQPPIASAPQVNLNVPVPTVPVYCPISGYRFFQNETGNVYSCPVSERFENSNGTVTTTANAVTITTQPKINTTSQPNMGQCIVKNIPLQKWVNVIVSVFNQVVDMYVDGELVSSCVLPGFPAMSSSDVKIAPRGGFSGQISRVTFYNSSMNVESAKSVYLSGPVNAASFLSNIPNWAYYVVGAILLLVIVYALM